MTSGVDPSGDDGNSCVGFIDPLPCNPSLSEVVYWSPTVASPLVVTLCYECPESLSEDSTSSCEVSLIWLADSADLSHDFVMYFDLYACSPGRGVGWCLSLWYAIAYSKTGEVRGHSLERVHTADCDCGAEPTALGAGHPNCDGASNDDCHDHDMSGWFPPECAG